MPVHFATAACSEPHVDASNDPGRRQDALRHLVGPSTFLDALFDQIEGIPDRYCIAVIAGGGVLEFGFFPKSALFSGTGSLEE